MGVFYDDANPVSPCLVVSGFCGTSTADQRDACWAYCIDGKPIAGGKPGDDWCWLSFPDMTFRLCDNGVPRPAECKSNQVTCMSVDVESWSLGNFDKGCGR